MFFENNYAYAGKTSVLYKITDGNTFSNHKSFEITCKNVYNGGTVIINTLNKYFHREWHYKEPFFILLEGLSPNVIYDISGYFIDINNERIELPTVTVKTLSNIGKVDINRDENGKPIISYDNISMDLRNTASFKTFVNKVIDEFDETLKLFTEFTIYNKQYTSLGIYNRDDGTAANSGQNYNYHNGVYDSVLRTVMVHEIGHNYMSKITPLNVNIRFMEFATDCEGAHWKWISGHCYPCISSQRYNLIDDILNIMAFEQSHKTDINNI